VHPVHFAEWGGGGMPDYGPFALQHQQQQHVAHMVRGVRGGDIRSGGIH
jgi:hypothetical protein